MLAGDNGILQRAEEAKNTTDEAQIKEKIRLSYCTKRCRVVERRKKPVKI